MQMDHQSVAIAKGMLQRGDKQHDIAAQMGWNPARVHELKSGEKYADIKAAPEKSLPPPKTGRFVDPNSPLAKQQEMFLALMRDPPENSRILTITPALAEWILNTYNLEGANRKAKPKRIQRYAAAMKEASWLLTGETVIMGKQQLLDGQNRLKGCVLSGKPFRSHVVFGISDNVFTVINSGKSRNANDTFYTAGVKDHAIVSQAIRWLMLYAEGNPKARSSYSNQDMWNFYNDPERTDQDALELAVVRAKMTGRPVPKNAMAAHFYLFAKKSDRTAAKMAADFDKNRHSARKLTAKLAKAKKDQQGRLNDVWVSALMVRTWNAYRENRSVTSKDLTWNMATQEYPDIA